MREAKTQIFEAEPSAPDHRDVAMLVLIRGPRLGLKVDLQGRQELVLGRDKNCHVALETDSASRRHCKFVRLLDQWYVEDLGSTNGTYVSGRRISSRVPVSNGELIQVGSAILKFMAVSDVEAAWYEEIHRVAIYDGLTQIHNRRYFEEFLDREVARAQRHQRPLALLIFDIDHFKQINDSLGHLAGDAALRLMAGVVNRRIRREELFARYAGDEFVVVLPEADLVQGEHFGRQLCQLVAESELTFQGHRLPVTVSVGVAALDNGMHGAQSLMQAADSALYRAKEAGRNRVSR
ncbi:MAG: GGDEF domain-containing protein [Myxococcales bacterium]|nr:GGDEF domain-containing protein [Myxococcales bacterium]MCB9522757.1 GGDEF domain-containing protein [Myxococcales bacterium]